MIIMWEHLSQLEQLWVNRSLDKKTLNIIESFWFHLVEIETIWETGQLTTKTCNWDSLIFFESFWFLFFLVVGCLVMSCHQIWDISNQPLLSFQRAVLSRLSCTQRACETFRDFNIWKWPLNFSEKIAEKILSVLVCFESRLNAVRACLKPFECFWG